MVRFCDTLPIVGPALALVGACSVSHVAPRPAPPPNADPPVLVVRVLGPGGEPLSDVLVRFEGACDPPQREVWTTPDGLAAERVCHLTGSTARVQIFPDPWAFQRVPIQEVPMRGDTEHTVHLSYHPGA